LRHETQRLKDFVGFHYRSTQPTKSLITNNNYQKADTSLIFPDFFIKEIVSQYVNRAWQVGSSVALREFGQTL
jgi:hypothetical protein